MLAPSPLVTRRPPRRHLPLMRSCYNACLRRNTMPRTLTLLIVILACAAWPLPAAAQFETATVLGTVRDASNAVVPEATVTLTNVATGVSATQRANAEGSYEFVTVPAGIYLLTMEKSGFAMAMVENVSVQVGSRLRVDAQMSVGQVTE